MFPVVVRKVTDGTYDELVNAYRESYGEEPSLEQKNAWRKLVDLLKGLEFPSVWEFPIFNERADIIFVGKGRALVVEAKGWRRVRKLGDYTVEADGEERVDPCYQLTNYVTKLNTFHSSGFKFDGVLFMYNNRDYSSDACRIIRTVDELRKELDQMGPGSQEDLEKLINGKIVLNETIVDLLNREKDLLKQNVARALLKEGFGLSEEQMKILNRVMEVLEKGEKRNFLIRGGSGSGKTLLAVTIFLEAFSKGHLAFLAYKNNRLINILKEAMRKWSGFIVYYSTGRGFGIGEEGFDEWFRERFGDREIDLVVFDEAQRMTEEVIKNSQRGRVNVYFYDDDQVLLANEAGTEENFKKYLGDLEEYELTSAFRAPKEFAHAVKGVLEGKRVEIPQYYDFRIFSRIEDMFKELGALYEKGKKVALICAFTESEGKKSKGKKSKNQGSIENLRIGYPLQSGFDLYKGTDIRVEWLMDERTEYPKYWMGRLHPLKYCASVYGSQGLEAEYVGVVWGRDLIWRNNGWTFDPDPITDNVGDKKKTLKSLASRCKTDPGNCDRGKVMRLLKNRYYIMLTRGMRGTFVFFEDKETERAVRELTGI